MYTDPKITPRSRAALAQFGTGMGAMEHGLWILYKVDLWVYIYISMMYYEPNKCFVSIGFVK
jgi:hypothetical protein